MSHLAAFCGGSSGPAVMTKEVTNKNGTLKIGASVYILGTHGEVGFNTEVNGKPIVIGMNDFEWTSATKVQQGEYL